MRYSYKVCEVNASQQWSELHVVLSVATGLRDVLGSASVFLRNLITPFRV
jgi:hypothetical protein